MKPSHTSTLLLSAQARPAPLPQAHCTGAGLTPGEDFAVLDGNPGPGGAWRHRWQALTLARPHGVHDLPDFPLENPDTWRPASEVVAEYYGAHEDHLALGVIRPAKVKAVTQIHHDIFMCRPRPAISPPPR